MGTEGLVQLIVYLLLGGVIVYLVYWVLGMVTLPQPAKQAIMVVLAIIVLLWLLRTFGLV